VRKGRNATGLEKKKAGLPKEDAFGMRDLLYLMAEDKELTTEDTEKARKHGRSKQRK
jgi:hypothetical protein